MLSQCRSSSVRDNRSHLDAFAESRITLRDQLATTLVYSSTKLGFKSVPMFLIIRVGSFGSPFRILSILLAALFFLLGIVVRVYLFDSAIYFSNEMWTQAHYCPEHFAKFRSTCKYARVPAACFFNRCVTQFKEFSALRLPIWWIYISLQSILRYKVTALRGFSLRQLQIIESYRPLFGAKFQLLAICFLCQFWAPIFAPRVKNLFVVIVVVKISNFLTEGVIFTNFRDAFLQTMHINLYFEQWAHSAQFITRPTTHDPYLLTMSAHFQVPPGNTARLID